MRWGKSIAVLLGMAILLWLRISPAAAAQDSASQDGTPAGAAVEKILVLGDSLSAEYGLPRDTGWVRLISQRLEKLEQAYQIRNASISGDTTGNGLRRLPQILAEFDADLVILQLGANDGLRGLPIADMKANLQKMIELGQSAGAQVLLVGQQIPPNYGRRYAEEFHAVYAELADAYGIGLVPFMLEGIATDATMFQADGLHPTVDAQAHIAATIWPRLEEML